MGCRRGEHAADYLGGDYRGNIAAVTRARTAVVSGAGETAGVPVPDFLVAGWAGAAPVTERTLQRAFERELTPAPSARWACRYANCPASHPGPVSRAG